MCLSATLQGHSKIGRQGSTHLTKPVECIEQERAQKFPFLLGERIQLPFHLQVSQVQRATWDRISREHSGLHLLPILSSLHGPFSKPVTIPMAIWSKLHPLLARKSLPLLYGQQSISASITNYRFLPTDAGGLCKSVIGASQLDGLCSRFTPIPSKASISSRLPLFCSPV